jgi:peptidyl-prolyl cis-trans isomerase B (cyclophilin B)
MRSAKITAGILIAFILIVFGVTFISSPDTVLPNDRICDNVQAQQQQQEEEIKLRDNQAPAGTIDQCEKPQKGDKIAIIKTTEGVIKARLFEKAVPETVENFTLLAEDGDYNGTVFHRVIKDFMIQTGDFEKGNGTGGYSYKGKGTKFNDEFHPDLTHLQGTLSMANSGKNTNGSQFFIVTAEEGTPHLNYKHSVFGQVYEGLDVALAISKVKTDEDSKPLDKIKIESITIKTND